MAPLGQSTVLIKLRNRHLRSLPITAPDESRHYKNSGRLRENKRSGGADPLKTITGGCVRVLTDTKFEFGADRETGVITLADEVLTSDSSRYWDAAAYAAGTTPAEKMLSFDKQIVRNWLSANWNKQGTPPELPADIVAQTSARYRELIERMLG